MEGDVLVVNEARAYGHAGLVVAEVEGEYRLLKTQRVGSCCHPRVGKGASSPQSSFARW